MSEELNVFRRLAREWIQANFPPSLKGKRITFEGPQSDEIPSDDLATWVQRLADQGWGVPTWPSDVGGGGLDRAKARVLQDELDAAEAQNPIPMLAGMGVTMVGPTLLEFGSDEQKARHLPGIARGEVRWCLGLSEPNAGSDLASLSTRAEERDDVYVINGQKTWTSGADLSEWCAALVRTGAGPDKRAGLSVLMLPMGQPGVTTRPIQLISGASPFCETFFTDAIAAKDDVLGGLGNGWTVIKRLLQYERQSQTTPVGSGGRSQSQALLELARRYVGTDARGQLNDFDLRLRIAQHLMDAEAHELTVRRIALEAKGGGKVSDAASILKNSATTISQTGAELRLEILGNQGVGWTGDPYTRDELAAVREWLIGKATSIYGGSFEIQNNIISKNILGLPEMTQKG